MRKLFKKTHRIRTILARAASDAFTDYNFVGRYFAMGAASTIIQFGIFWLLHELWSVWYILSATVAFLIRLIFKFHAMRTWLFGERVRGTARKHLFVFSVLEVSYLVGSLLLLAILVEIAGLAPLLALIISSAVTSVSALVLTRFIFKPRNGI